MPTKLLYINFYFRQKRCVKCAGDYATVQCPTKTRSDGIKYVPCNNSHPSSYKRCRLYKELESNMFLILREKTINSLASLASNVQSEPNQITYSYAEGVKIPPLQNINKQNNAQIRI